MKTTSKILVLLASLVLAASASAAVSPCDMVNKVKPGNSQHAKASPAPKKPSTKKPKTKK